jgi:SAM-dependent methyltransferase
MRMLGIGVRFGLNLVARVAEQEGYSSAAAVGSRYIVTEIGKLPRIAALAMREPGQDRHPPMESEVIVAAARGMGVELRPYHIDLDAFWSHVRASHYPRLYAAGTMSLGGAREQKLLEYFVSLDLLRPTASDVIIDIASEWSIFARVVRRALGARVYQQDLIYFPGLHGERIGGNARAMPIPDAFADKLVLHNAYEHFEGDADTAFVVEAWRVLRPGGAVCIAPLNLSDEYCIVSDPLVNRRGVVWDPGARVIELPLWHNRFGRFYDAAALMRRVIEPAQRLGFEVALHHVENVKAVHHSAYLHFVLILSKPS